MLSCSWIPSDSKSQGNWRLDSKETMGCPGLGKYTVEPSLKRLPVSRIDLMLRDAFPCAKPYPDGRARTLARAAGSQGAAVRGRAALLSPVGCRASPGQGVSRGEANTFLLVLFDRPVARCKQGWDLGVDGIIRA